MCASLVPCKPLPHYHPLSIYIYPGTYNLIAGNYGLSVSWLTLTVSRKSSRHCTCDRFDDASDNRIADVESSTTHRKDPIAVRVRYDKESRKVRQQVDDGCVKLLSINVTFCYGSDARPTTAIAACCCTTPVNWACYTLFPVASPRTNLYTCWCNDALIDKRRDTRTNTYFFKHERAG